MITRDFITPRLQTVQVVMDWETWFFIYRTLKLILTPFENVTFREKAFKVHENLFLFGKVPFSISDCHCFERTYNFYLKCNFHFVMKLMTYLSIFFQLGAGGSLFIIDHRGNIVLHDNIKPVVSSSACNAKNTLKTLCLVCLINLCNGFKYKTFTLTFNWVCPMWEWRVLRR